MRWLNGTALKCTLVLLLSLTVLADGPALAGPTEDGKSAGDLIIEKFGNSESLNQRAIVPLTTNTPMSTIDGSVTFDTQISCPSTKKFLEVFITPSATGDLSQVTIGQDTDMDGATDYSFTLPFVVSGICANGVISCTQGTWESCRYYTWEVDGSGKVGTKEAAATDLGGCYCINNDCGSNLVWNNLSVVLQDLGGGVVATIQAANPRYTVTDARISDTLITYYGQATENCYQTGGPGRQEQYYGNPSQLEPDTQTYVLSEAEDPESMHNLMEDAYAATGGNDIRQCSIDRLVTMTEVATADIIAPNGGTGQVRSCGQGCIEIVLGQEGDNYWSGWCAIYERYFNVFVRYPERIISAYLVRTKWDDWMQVWIGNTKVWSGPDGRFPPETSGPCELKTSWDRSPWLDVTGYFKQYGVVNTRVRVSVSGGGEGYAIVRVYVMEECTTEDDISNGCLSLETDPQCSLREETVDGVATYRQFNPTGLVPEPSCNLYTGQACSLTECRDWWKKERTYFCEDSRDFDFSDIQTRTDAVTGSVTDGGSSMYYQDLAKDESGVWISSSHSAGLNSKDSYATCLEACKTRVPVTDTGASSAGHTGQYQTSTQSWDFYYKRCEDSVCPLGAPGEEILKDCQCIDEFAEATAIMEALNAASKDFICSSGVRK